MPRHDAFSLGWVLSVFELIEYALRFNFNHCENIAMNFFFYRFGRCVRVRSTNANMWLADDCEIEANEVIKTQNMLKIKHYVILSFNFWDQEKFVHSLKTVRLMVSLLFHFTIIFFLSKFWVHLFPWTYFHWALFCVSSNTFDALQMNFNWTDKSRHEKYQHVEFYRQYIFYCYSLSNEMLRAMSA